jgi:putative membrane protein
LKHPVKADRFFKKEEKQRIHETTVDVESRTVGEIVVAVVDRSSNYREAHLLGAILLGSFISVVVTDIFFHDSIWAFIPLSFLLYFPSRLLCSKVPVLGRVFTGTRRKQLSVKEMALRIFYEKGLYRTKEGTGVLFFLSLLEKKVWILADKGIHGKIHQPTLNRFAEMVSRGINEGRACDALCEAIRGIGDLLATHYPAHAANPDELPDEVICGPGAEE